MNKFKYYEAPSLFLALSRGLFSVKEPAREPGDESCYRIIARGYDKFSTSEKLLIRQYALHLLCVFMEQYYNHDDYKTRFVPKFESISETQLLK